MLLHPGTGLTLSANSGLRDPFWTSVKFLSGAQGADGSTPIADESLSARAFTANGNAQITTAQSRFGGSSATFDGAGDFFTTPDSADFDFAAQDFAVELWWRPVTKVIDQAMIGQWDNAGTVSNCAWFHYLSGANLIQRVMIAGTSFDATLTPTLTTGTWYYSCGERVGSNLYVHFGEIGGTTTVSAPTSIGSAALTQSSNLLSIGRIGTGATFAAFDFNGQMEEWRVTKGRNRFGGVSGAVPTSPFPRG